MSRRGVAVALALACAAALALASLSVRTGGAPGGVPVEGGTSLEDAVEAVDGALDEMGVTSRRSERAGEGDVAEVAAELLEERGERGDCVLAHAGYLDLLGGTWGCVLQGNGWVELCLVTEGEEGVGCDVFTWRMRASELARLSPG